MKHIRNLALLMIVALAMTSCDLFNVDVDTEVGGALNIAVEDNLAKGTLTPPYWFSEHTDLSADSDEIQEYKDKIDNVAVGSITATVESVSVAEVVIQRDAVFTITGADGIPVEWILPEDWTIFEGAFRMIEDQGGFYGKVSDILGDVDNDFEIKLEGHSSKNGVYFVIYFNIVATITGSIF
jgi:hypothetical protein